MNLRKVIIAICFFGILAGVYAVDYYENVYTSDGKQRTFFLHTPPGYDGVTPLPLVICLHYGGFQQGENMAMLTGMSGKADQVDYIVAYPDALSPGWSNHDVLFLDELVDTLKARYAVDEKMIFMTGYSAGAVMSHWMACKLADEVAAFGPVAGTMLSYDWTGCYPTQPPSIVSINARDDPALPYEGDGGYYTGVEEAMSNWAERLECDEGPDSFTNETGALRQTWSRSDGKCDIVLWTTEAGGHGWPTEFSAHQLSANDVLFDFFAAHPLQEPVFVEEEPSRADYVIDADIPQFFTRTTTVRFRISKTEKVGIELFDALGRRAMVPVRKEFAAGEHSIILDGGSLKSGVYFCRIKTPSYVKTEKLIK